MTAEEAQVVQQHAKHTLVAAVWWAASATIVVGAFFGGLRLLEYVTVPVAYGLLGVTLVAVFAAAGPAALAQRATRRADELLEAREDAVDAAHLEFIAAADVLDRSTQQYTELAEPLHQVKKSIPQSAYIARNLEVRDAADDVEQNRNAAWSAADEWMLAARTVRSEDVQPLVEERLGPRTPGHWLR